MISTSTTFGNISREGVDFAKHGDYIVFLNKKALRVIPESLDLGIEQVFDMVMNGKDFIIDNSDKGLLEKLKRRLNGARITAELEKLINSGKLESQEKFEEIYFGLFVNKNFKELLDKNILNTVVRNIYLRLYELSKSNSEVDITKYIRLTSIMIEELNEMKVLSVADFKSYLNTVISSKASFNLRKEALFEKLAMDFKNENLFKEIDLNDFTDTQKYQIIKEIKGWYKSKDHRKKKIANNIDQQKKKSLEKDDLNNLKILMDLKLVHLNERNLSGFSLLLEAQYFDAKQVIEFLLRSPGFDLTKKDKHGNTDVEQLRLLGKSELADLVEKLRPESKSKKVIETRERNFSKKTAVYPMGEPIIDFVKIEPGTFKMGEGEQKVVVTLTESFEMMSVDTTQKMWRTVVELAGKHFKHKYKYDLNADPSYFKGDDNPVESISHDDIKNLWEKALDDLSNLDNQEVQSVLAELFPGHKKGAKYRLPTEAEDARVRYLLGVAGGDYAHGPTAKNLGGHAWHDVNSNRTTHPVGQKKPIYINGKPIYDVHGNVYKWVADSWDGQAPLPGGINPLNVTGSFRLATGASWHYEAQYLRSGFRAKLSPDYKNGHVGFRLVRTFP